MSDNAKEQAIAQAQSIIAYVAALNVDYYRLEELRDERASYDHPEEWNFKNQEEVAELDELEADAGDCKDADEARERIQEDALEVQVRSDWYNPCGPNGGETDNKPSEFYILLCTGGPAVRIMGELDQYLQPSRAWIEYQDWGTSWTQLYNEIEQSTLISYCQQFYFGE